ncbi:MAG TPA: NADH-quinone oxidoreductase subunit NuoH [Acidimicrobiales bacterium]|nr:NADH-quinone oxidoreductase subunit NuoH [Acidimicrobiales bacterium]
MSPSLLHPLLAEGDPIYAHGIGLGVVIIVCVKVIVAFAVLLVSVLMMVWFERKVISDMQNRIGPDRAGRWGILQSVADGIKLFFKEDLLPDNADRRIFRLAPYLSAVPAFLSFAIVPVGGTITLFHHTTELQVADPPMGILFLLAMSAVAVYGVMLAGWSSGSKYPLLGSVRASAQMVSYEAALGLSIASVVLVTGGLTTREMVDNQNGVIYSFIPNWNVFRLGFVPFVIFLLAATAELNRPPFDLVEAEQELVGGFHTEYSSIRFALFYLAEFMNTVTMSAIVVTLFLGGPDGPGFHFLPWLWPILWFVGKTMLFLFTYVWLRATLPRLRYDQLMDLGWKRLIPVSLVWLLVLAAMLINLRWGFAVFAGCVVFFGLLIRSMRVGAQRRELEEAASMSVPPPPGRTLEGAS